MFKLFVYIKNDTHNFDTYRIYINHQQMYSQTNLIYEQELFIEMKQKSKIFRHNMYIMFEEAYKMNENVCGTYIQVSDYLNKW